MTTHAVLPKAVNGLTTGVNDTVTATSKGTNITGSTVMISVGIAAVFPIYIMFGRENQSTLLTATTGFKLPAGFVGRIDVPLQATVLYYLRAAASDSDISILPCDGGI